MKIKYLLLFLIALTSWGFSQPKNIAQELNGALVKLEQNRLAPFDAASLDQTKFFVLYFSAHWCPPCRAFTPKLVDFYMNQKSSHPEFEVIFISNDRSEEDMLTYIKELKMPWPAIKFSKIEKAKRIKAYAGSGIPCVVVVDADGKVLADSFKGSDYLGPQKPLDDLVKLLKN